MKKYLIFLFLLTSLDSFSQTSVYHPFPNSNAYWRVNYYESPSNPCTGTGLLASYQYTYDGDTIINSNIYKKILKSGAIFSLCYPGTPLGYQGAFREDTILKRAYLVLPGDTMDSLLYDFNLQVGDTVNSVLHSLSIYGNNCAPYIITAMDSQLIGSSYRKRWTIGLMSGLCIQARYVEGVGNLFGFLDSYYTFEEGPLLLCFSVNNQPQYYIGPISVCNPLSINEIPEQAIISNLLISPNPVSDNFFNVDTGIHLTSEIRFIDIYNSTGITCHFNWTKYSDSMILINNFNLSPGIYLLTVRTSNSNYLSAKFMIHHQ